MIDSTWEYRLGLIVARHERRIAGGQVGGVQEWFEIATLLEYIKSMQTDWEYCVKKTDSDDGDVIIFDDWSELKYAMADLEWYQSDDATNRIGSEADEYSLVRRRKAGPAEDVDE